MKVEVDWIRKRYNITLHQFQTPKGTWDSFISHQGLFMQPKMLFLALAVCLAAPAYAEESGSGEAEPRIEEVVVIGHPLSSDGLAQSHTVPRRRRTLAPGDQQHR